MSKKKVFGIGINDADYAVQKFETISYINGKLKQKNIWTCPYYSTWYSMLRRCYSKVLHKNRPSYIGCSTFQEWWIFSKFKAWMETQDWEGKHLDKDILVQGNKVYSPETCVFVDQSVNSFLNDHKAGRGDFPIGVSWHKRDEVFTSQINDGTGKQIHLGNFATPEEAHNAWLVAKREISVKIAAEQKDQRVADALVNRYQSMEML